MRTKLVFPLLFILDPGHEHSYTETVTEPTCTEQGYTTYTCSCGDSYEGNIVPALGHDFVLIGQNGTTATYQCSQCGYTYNEIVTPNPPVEEISLDLDEGCSDRTLVSTITERHEYVYMSGRLTRETITTTNGDTVTTQILDFVYGSGSTPLALVYTNGTASPVTYYYVTNMQGDVVKLVTADGTTAASYTYDAWGKVVSATGSMAEVNPIRYRGYYYDAEIGMYYLQSRYYDPVIKRFVNADALMYAGIGFLGYNMYSYCCNSPAQYSDNSGYIFVPADEETKKQWGLFLRAISYLKRSAKAREIIEILESPDVTIIIQINDDRKMSYGDGVIFFDPHAGLVVFDCEFNQKGDAMPDDGTVPMNGIQSPAMGLIHEMGHAVQHLGGLYDEYAPLGQREARAALESHNLANNESIVASELNEPCRNDYRAARGYVYMAGPTQFFWAGERFASLRRKLEIQEL